MTVMVVTTPPPSRREASLSGANAWIEIDYTLALAACNV